MDSDIPTQSFDPSHGGAKQDALGVGKGAREQAPVQWVAVPDNPSLSLDPTLACDAMDTSETLTRKRGRATVEGVMDSDIPTQSAEKKSRLGDLHLAFVMDNEVA